MTFKISAKDLIEFKDRSARIAAHGILPILSSIKLELNGKEGLLIKNTLNSFVSHKVEVKGYKGGPAVVLLDPNYLYPLLSKAKGKEVTFEVEMREVPSTVAKKTEVVPFVFISDGEFEAEFQSYNHDTYPKLPSRESEDVYALTQPVLEALYLAREHAGNVVQSWISYVHTQKLSPKESVVFATDATAVFYYKRFSEALPTLCLEPEVVSVISNFQSLMYCKSGNYHFFDAGNTVYGFIDTVYTPRDLAPIMNEYNNRMQFLLSRKQVQEYLEFVISIHKKDLGEALMWIKDAGKGKILLQYANNIGSGASKKIFDVEGKNSTVRDFCFPIPKMLTCIKHLPYDVLEFSVTDFHNCYLKTPEDATYIGAVREILFSQPQ